MICPLNSKHFAYVTHGDNHLVFGDNPNPTKQADLQIVILHELGHWAGTKRHIDEDERNVMRSTILPTECIDATDAMLLQTAISDQHIMNDKQAVALHLAPSTQPVTKPFQIR